MNTASRPHRRRRAERHGQSGEVREHEHRRRDEVHARVLVIPGSLCLPAVVRDVGRVHAGFFLLARERPDRFGVRDRIGQVAGDRVRRRLANVHEVAAPPDERNDHRARPRQHHRQHDDEPRRVRPQHDTGEYQGRNDAEIWNAATSNTSSNRRAKPSARLVSDPA
jgi:hypothetical protein